MFNPFKFKSKSNEEYLNDLLKSILLLRKEEAELKKSILDVGMKVKTNQMLIKQASAKGDYTSVHKLQADKEALMNKGRSLWELRLEYKSNMERLEKTYKQLNTNSRQTQSKSQHNTPYTSWSNDSLESKFWDLDVEEELQGMKRRVRVS